MKASIDQYQEFCLKNWSAKVHTEPALYMTVGLAGEVGEVAEIIKKAFRDSKQVDREALTKEIGDVLWYLTNIASLHKISLQDVIDTNIFKLNSRHGGTYQPESSDSEVGYRLKGPHIEKYNLATGKHIKFVKREEVPTKILDELYKTEAVEYCQDNDDLPF